MFLLAQLYMKSFKVKLNAVEVEDALKSLPKGYDFTYESTMKRINAISTANPNDNNSAIAIRVLSWVACAYRPLSLLELQHALAVDLNNGFSTLAIYDKETLLDITAGLVTVDSDESAVRLVHLTAQEFFNRERERWFPNASAFITQISLKYLSHPYVAEPFENFPEDPSFDKRRRDFLFLVYAYQHWRHHAFDAGPDTKAQAAVLGLVGDPKKIRSSIQAAKYLGPVDHPNWDIRKSAYNMHRSAWFGLAYALASLSHKGLEDLQK